MGLHGSLSLKMSTYMTEIDYLVTFITKPNFPIKLLKNSLSFGKNDFVIKVGQIISFSHVGAHFQAKSTM